MTEQEILDRINNRFEYDQLNLLVADAAYLAGIIDGEGCITVTTRNNKQNFEMQLNIGTTDNVIVPYVSNILKVDYRIRESSNPNGRPIKQIWLSGKRLIPIMVEILPYIKLKKAQCLLCLEMIYWQSLGNRWTGVFKRDRQEEIYLEIKKLNSRGIVCQIKTTQEAELLNTQY